MFPARDLSYSISRRMSAGSGTTFKIGRIPGDSRLGIIGLRREVISSEVIHRAADAFCLPTTTNDVKRSDQTLFPFPVKSQVQRQNAKPTHIYFLLSSISRAVNTFRVYSRQPGLEIFILPGRHHTAPVTLAGNSNRITMPFNLHLPGTAAEHGRATSTARRWRIFWSYLPDWALTIFLWVRLMLSLTSRSCPRIV